ncbi:fasciclin domain-containing protein [Pontibacter qinzhouensis]|uniref:Fasciclin domain-containing protein n=1 Tax=Pontibacter qinzhouensis TaxID=2603253 RepID=A0A5C8KAG3_9BACT|nr:fasciclin domain-containing protein [Pontibacter qinzhouensis]TXK48031.1 fasciclin domain-containing protein [Pontibacter qinzhouensis]
MKIDFAKGIGILLVGGAILVGCSDSRSTQEEGTEVIQSRMASYASPGLQPELPPPAEAEKQVAGRTGQPDILQHIDRENNLQLFSAALKKTDLTQSLLGTGPYTVFAPNDAAFKNLKADTSLAQLLAPENRQQLKQLLSNHMVTGKLSINELQDGTTLKTTGGQQLNVTKRNGKVFINDAVLEATDEGSSNGVVHVLSKVLQPAS